MCNSPKKTSYVSTKIVITCDEVKMQLNLA